jgi:hypothetical protein
MHPEGFVDFIAKEGRFSSENIAEKARETRENELVAMTAVAIEENSFLTPMEGLGPREFAQHGL